MGNSDHLHDHQIGGLPRSVQRQLAGKCERCDLAVVAGKRFCQHHLEDKRARERKSAGKRRKDRRKRRLCIDCAKPSKRRRCRACWKRSRGVNQNEQGVNQTWRVDPGTNWNRYRGKAKRGRLTREQQIEEDARDARWAIAEIEKFVAALAVLKRPEVMDLPTIQRDAVRREVGQYLGVAGRFLDELAEKYG